MGREGKGREGRRCICAFVRVRACACACVHACVRIRFLSDVLGLEGGDSDGRVHARGHELGLPGVACELGVVAEKDDEGAIVVFAPGGIHKRHARGKEGAQRQAARIPNTTQHNTRTAVSHARKGERKEGRPKQMPHKECNHISRHRSAWGGGDEEERSERGMQAVGLG